MLQEYERAKARFQSLENDLHEHLKRLLAPAEGSGAPTMRQLAFIEGLRSERDQAWDRLKVLERGLFNAAAARTGILPEEAT
jgi:hypothetical protein